MAKKLTEEEAAQLSKRLDDLISSMDSDEMDGGEDRGGPTGEDSGSPKTVIRVEGSGDQFNRIADNLIKRLKSTKVDYPKLRPEWADWTRK